MMSCRSSQTAWRGVEVVSYAQMRLGDRDRERLGCPEWLDFDYTGATIEDIEAICDATGIDFDEWPSCLLPAVRFEDMEKPEAKPRTPAWRNRCLVFLALRQNGIESTWADAGKVRWREIMTRVPTVEEPPKGEDGPGPSASESSDEPTIPSSATSTQG
jgi:hypothetical protein